MKKIIFIMGLLLIMPIIYSASLPSQALNPYYKELFGDWLNGTIDTRESGKLIIGLNTSFYNLNITNILLVIGNVNITLNLNVSGEIYLRGQPVQIEATSFKISNGTALPFSDFRYSNITLFLGVPNESMIKVGNTSWIQSNEINPSNATIEFGNIGGYSSAFTFVGNLSYNNTLIHFGNRTWVLEMIDNSTINRSITNLNNLEYYEWRATAFNDVNNGTKYVRGVDIGFVNLSRLGNIDINTSGSLNVSGNITFRQLISCDTINTDANGLLTCGSDATGGGDTSAFNLGNYSSEYSSTGYKLSNFTSNYDSRTDRYGNTNFTTQYDDRLDRFLNINFTTLYNNILDRFGNINWTTLYNNEALTRFLNANWTVLYNNEVGTRWQLSNTTQRETAYFLKGNISNTLYPSFNATKINGTNITGINITATRFTGKVDCGMIDGGSDSDYCVDATGTGGGITNGSSANLTNLNVNTINNTDLSLFNKSIDLSTYNKSVDLSSYNRSVDLSGYVSNAGIYLINGSSANFTDINVESINGTDIVLFNKSIDLSTYNRSISLVDYKTTDTNCSALNSCVEIFYSNNLTNVGNINRSINLGGYATTSQLGSQLTNNSPANITALNVETLNGTALNLFNKSIDLSSYNRSVDLSSYNRSVNLVNYNYSIDLSSYNRTITTFGCSGINQDSGGGDTDFCNDATGTGGFVNDTPINVTSIVVRSGGINSSGDINTTTNFYIGTNAVLTAISSFFNSFWNIANNQSTRETSYFNFANNLTYNNTLLNQNHLTPLWNKVNQSDRETAYYNIINYSDEYSSTGFKIANLTSHPLFKLSNYSTEYSSTGYKIINFTDEYARSGYKIGNATGGLTAINNSLFTKLGNDTNIRALNINMSYNLSMQTNQSINFLNRSTQKAGFLQFWNDTCFIQRNLVSGNNVTIC